MKIYIATDHRGFELKGGVVKALTAKGYNVTDLGAKEYVKSDDYPDYAFKLGEHVSSDPGSIGILFCRSGIGMTTAANKVNGIFASLVDSLEDEALDKSEHSPNVLIFSSDSHDSNSVLQIFGKWEGTDFAGGRHLRRINKIRHYENLHKYGLDGEQLVIPTIMTADTAEADSLMEAFDGNVPIINFDIADGDFVDGKTIGIDQVLEYLPASTEYHSLPSLFSIHIMKRDPKPDLKKLNNSPGMYIVYIHHESDIGGIVEQEWSFNLGLTANPETNVSELDYANYPIVQFMSVTPGGQGRGVEPGVLEKASELRDLGFEGEVHYDGSINFETADQFVKTGAIGLNVGTAVVKSPDPMDAWVRLQENIISLK